MELNKKFVIGSVNMSHVKTEETRQMWTTTLGELRVLMEQRAKLFIWQPLTNHEHFKVPVPDGIDDEYGCPPVVVWLGPLQQKEGKRQAE